MASQKPTKKKSPVPSLRELRDTVIHKFPYPIAAVYADLDDPKQSLQTKQTALYFTVYQLMRCVALPFISAYLHKEKLPENLSIRKLESFNTTLAGLRSPFFSSWIAMLNKLAAMQDTLEIAIFDPVIVQQGRRAGPGPKTFSGIMQTLQQTKITVAKAYGLDQGTRLQLNLLEAFWGLRNGTAHAGRSTGTACQEDLQRYRPLLDELLHHFRWLADCTLWQLASAPHDDPAQVLELRGPQPAGPGPMHLSDALYLAFKQAPVVMQIPGHEAATHLPLYPLFFGYLEGEPIHAYDGHYLREDAQIVRRTIYYLGTEQRFPVDDDDPDIVLPAWVEKKAGERLRELLERRQVRWELSKAEVKPWTLRETANDFSRRTYNEQLGVKYFPACYLERDILLQPLREFVLRSPLVATYPFRGLLLTGGSGSGKTALLTHLAGELLQQNLHLPIDEQRQHIVFYLRGDGFLAHPSGNLLFQNVAHKMGLKAKDFSGFAELFQRLRAGLKEDEWRDKDGKPLRRFILLLDALNEAPGPEQVMAETVDLLQTARDYPFVRVVFSLRSEAFEVLTAKKGENETHLFYSVQDLLYPNPQQRDKLAVPAHACPPLSLQEAKEIYGRYQNQDANLKAGQSALACKTLWQHLPQDTQKLLTNPLYLHLFHETFAGGDAEGIGGHVVDLFEAFVSEKRKKILGMRAALQHLTDYMLQSGRPNFTDADALVLRQTWQQARALAEEELRFHFSPLELCEMEGIVQKRVREEGGGYRIPFQALREYLLFEAFARRCPGMSAADALAWQDQADNFPHLPEYLAVLYLVMRRYIQENHVPEAARLYGGSLNEASERYTTHALRDAVLLTEDSPSPQGLDFAIALANAAPDLEPDVARALCNRVNFDLTRALQDDARRSSMAAILQANAAALAKLGQQNPKSQTLARDLSVSYNKLGDLSAERGNIDDALNFYHDALKIAEDLHRRAPDSAQYTTDLAVSHAKLGSIYEKIDPQQSRHYLRLCRDTLQEMQQKGQHLQPQFAQVLASLEQLDLGA